MMNTITQTDCQYISPNKTIESLLISDGERDKTVYVYNYKGQSYRVFLSKNLLAGFWLGISEEDYHFNTENELDTWLNSVLVK